MFLMHDFFKNSFFPFTVIKWNKIDKNIQKSESVNTFKKIILKLYYNDLKTVLKLL